MESTGKVNTLNVGWAWHKGTLPACPEFPQTGRHSPGTALAEPGPHTAHSTAGLPQPLLPLLSQLWHILAAVPLSLLSPRVTHRFLGTVWVFPQEGGRINPCDSG